MPSRRWLGQALVGLALVLSGCEGLDSPAPAPAAPRPTRPQHTPTANIRLAFIIQTQTPTPVVPPSLTQSTLPRENGWSGDYGCPGPVSATLGTGSFAWPTEQHALVGRDYDPVNHPGLDLSAALDAPIRAADSGAVVYAGWNVWGYGNLVIVDHGNGWHTLYAHLDLIVVTCGQGVRQGDLLGRAGSTGHSTGPHLHFEMRSSLGRVNPWNYLP